MCQVAEPRPLHLCLLVGATWHCELETLRHRLDQVLTLHLTMFVGYVAPFLILARTRRGKSPDGVTLPKYLRW